jgi:hypothetical protein
MAGRVYDLLIRVFEKDEAGSLDREQTAGGQYFLKEEVRTMTMQRNLGPSRKKHDTSKP